jgi:hypothetical protein
VSQAAANQIQDQVTELPKALAGLVEALMRAATAERFILTGFLGRTHDPAVLVHFGNVAERGQALAELYRFIADLIEEKSCRCQTKVILTQRPN